MINATSYQIGQTVSVKISGEIVTGKYVGFDDAYGLPRVEIKAGGKSRIVLRKIQGAVNSDDALSLLTNGRRSLVLSDDVRDTMEDVARFSAAPARVFDINSRFSFLCKMVRMVAVGPSNSCLIVGKGGLGKSYNVKKTLDACGAKNYTIIKGFCTPKSLYRKLYEHADEDGLIVFDDCDSILSNRDAVNLLKAAVDTDAVRKVYWLTERMDEELPNDFEFRGKLIFISNLQKEDVDQTIVSRCLTIDVGMTTDEKIQRLNMILPEVRPELSLETKREVLNFIDALKDRCHDLNMRTFLKCCDIRQMEPEDWKDIAEYSITV